MTFSSMAVMFGVMFVMALVPAPSVFAVVARSISSGFTHGLVTTAGIITGDYIFILMAVFGLWSFTETMGSLFVIVKYFGGAYLAWLGVMIWRTNSKMQSGEEITEVSWTSNFTSGLLITLSDPKAILFYISFLPAFIDLSTVSISDIATIMIIVTVTVGGVKLGYAYMADRARLFFNNPRAKKAMNITAGSVMIGTGLFLVTST